MGSGLATPGFNHTVSDRWVAPVTHQVQGIGAIL